MLSAAKVIAEQIVNKTVSNNGRVPWWYAANLLKLDPMTRISGTEFSVPDSTHFLRCNT
jgi:hypothetical protein